MKAEIKNVTFDGPIKIIGPYPDGLEISGNTVLHTSPQQESAAEDERTPSGESDTE